MSTRCQLGFYYDEDKFNEPSALIYRHGDGHPDTVLSDLQPIILDFAKNRGCSDIEYFSAWVVAKLKDDYTNIGICKGLHGDIEYYYALYKDRIDVYEAYNSGDITFDDIESKLLKTVEYKDLFAMKEEDFSKLYDELCN